MKIIGKVVHGKKIGGHYGVATANIEVKELPLLKEGVYIVRVEYEGQEYAGVMYFGHRITFENDFVIEVHLFEFEQDIYSKEITVISEKFLRETKKFDSTEALFSQIKKDILQTKKYFLRKGIQKKWKNVSKGERELLEKLATEKIIQNDSFRDSRSIFVYAPDEFEINFVQKLCSQFPEKQFYFPKIEKGRMKFYISQYEDLRSGKFGMGEPIVSSKNFGKDPDLVFVPAMAIDRDGDRLGRGGGFYDRFLENHPEVKTISVMPEFSVVLDVPKETHDMRVGEVILVE